MARAAGKVPTHPNPPPVSSVTLQIGQPAPDFRLPTDEGKEITLSEFLGKKVVLYFYPKDDTPGCTKESCSFRDAKAEIAKREAVILGASVDSVDSHRKFKTKFHLNFPLISDVNKELVQAYGVWKQKSMYGRMYMGIERTTVIIDETGRIARIFPNVNVEQHLDDVLAVL